MNIWTAKGENVKFLGDNGMNIEIEEAKQILEVGREYTVECVNVGRCYSVVCLKEVPNEEFNTVMFENVSDQPREVSNRDEYVTWKGRKK